MMPKSNGPAPGFVEALSAGYSPQELIDYHLATGGPDAAPYRQALDAGYTPAEIVAHLSGAKARSDNTFEVDLADGRRLHIASDHDAPTLSGAPKDRSIVSALPAGVSQVIGGIGSTLKNYGAPQAGAGLERTAAAIMPRGYESANERLMAPKPGDITFMGYGVGALPRAAVEGAPGLASDLLAAKLGARIAGGGRWGVLAKALGAAFGGIGSYMARSAGGEAEARATRRTGEADAAPSDADKAVAAVSTAAQGALGQIALNRYLTPTRVPGVGVKGLAEAGRKQLTNVATTGATSVAQDAVSQAGQTLGTPEGLDIDPRQLGAAGLTGAASGAVVGLPRAARDAVQAARFRNMANLSEPSAAVANRILQRVDDVSDLQNPKVAYRATNEATADVLNELKTARALMKANLSPEADNALARAAKGSDVTDGDLRAVKEATKDLEGGDRVHDLIGQAAALARLKVKGVMDSSRERFSGGVSERILRTASRNPLLALAGAGTATTLGDVASLIAAPAAMAKAAAIGGAAYGVTRGVERTLGLTSPARSFVEKFADPSVSIRVAGSAPVPTNAPKGTSGVPAVPLPSPSPLGYPKPAEAIPNQSERIIDDGVSQLVKRIATTRRLKAKADALDADPDPFASIRAKRQSADNETNEQIGRSATVEEVPVSGGLLHAKVNPLDLGIAVKATDEFKRSSNPPPVVESRYFTSTADRQARIRDRLMALSGERRFPSDDVALGDALDKIRHVRSREALEAYVNQVASTQPREVGDLIRAYFGPEWAKSVWNPSRPAERQR